MERHGAGGCEVELSAVREPILLRLRAGSFPPVTAAPAQLLLDRRRRPGGSVRVRYVREGDRLPCARDCDVIDLPHPSLAVN